MNGQGSGGFRTVLGCPKCGDYKYSVVNSKKIKHPRYGIIAVEMRQCEECGHRYRVAGNGLVEFYYE